MKKFIKFLSICLFTCVLTACSGSGLSADNSGEITDVNLGPSKGQIKASTNPDNTIDISCTDSDQGVAVGIMSLNEGEQLTVEYNLTSGFFNYSPGTIYRNDEKTLEIFKKLKESFKDQGISGTGTQNLNIGAGRWTIAVFANGGATGTIKFYASPAEEVKTDEELMKEYEEKLTAEATGGTTEGTENTTEAAPAPEQTQQTSTAPAENYTEQPQEYTESEQTW